MTHRMLALWGAIALMLGFLITQQIRTVAILNRTTQSEEAQLLSQLIGKVDQSLVSDANAITTLSGQLKSLAPSPALTSLKGRLTRVLPLADLTSVEGPGVEVVMHDGSANLFPGEPPALQLIHDQYVLQVVGLLSGAGARAIAINGQRYSAITSIYCAGPTIRINGTPYASPFVVTAIGPSAAMIKALATNPDIEGWSQLVYIKYHSVSRVKIPPYNGLVNLSLAKPDKIGE